METRQELRQNSGWIVGIGILLVLLGLFAIAWPIFTTFAINIMLGWLFIVGGIGQMVYAFRSHGAGSTALKVLLGLIYFGVGVLLLFNPWAGAVSLTLVVGIFFFIDGAFRVVTAFQVKPAPRWGWMLFNGIVTIILGILIWSQWPFNAPWILGLLVGIGLIVSGISTMLFPAALKRSSSVE